MKKSSYKEDTKGGNKGKYRGKGSAGKSNRRSFGAPRDVEKAVEDRNNDWKWYAADEQILKDAASYAFGRPLGSMLSRDGNIEDSYSIPGLCVLDTMSTPGISISSSSNTNLAATNIYTFVRHVNSGHTNYEVADLFLYLLAMDSIYTLYSHVVRAYGLMRTYSLYNRYIPRYLVESLHIDFDSIKENPANVRARINILANKIGALAVPQCMTYFLRHIWLYSGVYKDSPVVKASLYAFAPYGYYKYNPTKYPSGGCCEFIRLDTLYTDGHKADINELLDALESAIGIVAQDEDCNIMSGDILKAYGAENCIRMPEIPDDFTIIPEFNEEVLTQIHNAICIGVPNNATYTQDGTTYLRVDVTQRNGFLYWNPVWKTDGYGYIHDRLLSLPYDTPEPKDVMVASRFMNIANSQTISSVGLGATAVYHSLGSDVVNTVSYYFFTYDSQNDTIVLDNARMNGEYNIETNYDEIIFQAYDSPEYNRRAVAEMLDTLSDIATFAFHPRIQFFCDPTNDDVESKVEAPERMCFWDVDNWVMLSQHDIEKMHDVAMLNQFGIPTLPKGKVN